MKKPTLWIIISLVTILLLGLIGFFGYRGYKSYKIGRYNQEGEATLAQGNWALSRFWYGKTLEMDRENVLALSQLAKNAGYFSDPEELTWWKALVQIQPESGAAQFGYAEALLRKNQLEDAKRILDSIDPTAEQEAKYYNLKTAFFIATKDFAKAEELARKTLDKQPGSFELQLNLLNILLQKGDPTTRDEVNSLLSKLSANDDKMPRLWRVLLAYSLGQKNWNESIVIAEKLANLPSPRWTEQVAYLKLLIKLDPDKVPEYLSTIKNPPIAMIEEISRLLNNIGYSKPVLVWLNQLIEDGLEENLSIQIAKADTLNSLKEWNQLIDYVRDQDWSFFDYYRNLLQSRAYLALGKDLESNRTWIEGRNKAYDAGTQEVIRMVTLLESWPEYQPQWLDLLEDLLKDSVHVQWAYNKLQSYYYSFGATQQLYHISQLARKTLTNDTGIQNNYIMQGLLLKDNLSRLLEEAKTLSESFPGKPIPTSTYAFALYQNGQKEAAYKLISSLDERYFDIAEIAHYAAVIAQGAGDNEAAKVFREKAKNATLLPEEKALLGQ